jgi:2-keto-4-pentenoate hydratase
MLTLAERLWQAREQGSIVGLADVVEPANLQQAYGVQNQIVRLAGHTVVGFKVGSTSKEAQHLLGTSEPGSGPILAPYLHLAPARVAIVPTQMPAVEGEFAFRLGRTLPPREAAYRIEELAEAIDGAAGAIEIVGSRLAGGLAQKGRHFVTADGGGNIALITGPWTSDWRAFDLKAERVVMRINGKERGRGEGARALGNPLEVMVWLANQQSRFGRGLKIGDVVSTGTCTGLDEVKPGDQVVAEFAALGSVELALQG